MGEDIGKLVLRLTLGGLILLHGVHKLAFGISGIEGMVQGVGLPGALAYGAYVGEVIAPLFVITGYHARVGAALIVVQMLFAIGLAHRQQLLALTPAGGWAIELQAFYLLTALALTFMGPGRLAVRHG